MAARRAGLSSGFHSQLVASWKTRSSEVAPLIVSLCTPSSSSAPACAPWLISRARSFAGFVGQAANSARVGDQCLATGDSLGTLLPCW